MENVGKKMVHGAAWMMLFKLVDRSLGLISTIILARLLVPADFGLVAMAMSLVAMLELFGAFGFDVTLIARESNERRHYDTAWTFNVLFGVFIAVALLLAARPAASFFSDPRLVPVMAVLAAASFVQAFENIGVVAFRRELRFDREFRFLLGKRIAGVMVSVPLALAWQSYWALVAGILASRIANALLSYYVHPYRPRLSMAAARELFGFSRWLLINRLLEFGRTRSGDIVIGRLAGAHSLGLYSVGYELAYLPATELVAPINRAVFPGYARIAADRSRLKDHFLRVLGVIVALTLPAGAGIALTAHLFVPLVLGAKWLDAVTVIQVLALGGVLSALQSNFVSVYLAIGRPRITTEMLVLNLVMLIPLLILLTRSHGFVGAALAVLIVNAFWTIANIWRLVSALDMPVRAIFRHLHRPLIATLVMAAALSTAFEPGQTTASAHEAILPFAVAVAAGGTVYVAVLMMLWRVEGRPPGAERDLLDLLSMRLRSRGNGAQG
jgi:O-antigen/teichoic acid export membrane protein